MTKRVVAARNSAKRFRSISVIGDYNNQSDSSSHRAPTETGGTTCDGRRSSREQVVRVSPPPTAAHAKHFYRHCTTFTPSAHTHTIIIIISYSVVAASRGRVPARSRPSRTHKLRALFKHIRLGREVGVLVGRRVYEGKCDPAGGGGDPAPAEPIPLYSCQYMNSRAPMCVCVCVFSFEIWRTVTSTARDSLGGIHYI